MRQRDWPLTTLALVAAASCGEQMQPGAALSFERGEAAAADTQNDYIWEKVEPGPAEASRSRRLAPTLWLAPNRQTGWAGGRGGLYRLEDGEWSKVEVEGLESRAESWLGPLVLDPQGRRGWVFGRSSGARFDGHAWVPAPELAALLQGGDSKTGLVHSVHLTDDGQTWVVVWSMSMGKSWLLRHDGTIWRRDVELDELLPDDAHFNRSWVRADGAEAWLTDQLGSTYHLVAGAWSRGELPGRQRRCDFNQARLWLSEDGQRGWIDSSFELVDGRWVNRLADDGEPDSDDFRDELAPEVLWVAPDARSGWAVDLLGRIYRLDFADEGSTWKPAAEIDKGEDVRAHWFSPDGRRGFLLVDDYVWKLEGSSWSYDTIVLCPPTEERLDRPVFDLDPHGMEGLLVARDGCVTHRHDGHWALPNRPEEEIEPVLGHITDAWLGPDGARAWVLGRHGALRGTRVSLSQEPPTLVRSSAAGKPLAGEYLLTLAPGMAVDVAAVGDDHTVIRLGEPGFSMEPNEPGSWTLTFDLADQLDTKQNDVELALSVRHSATGMTQLWLADFPRL